MVADGPLVLPRLLQNEIVAHAKAGLPNEACGILGGRDGTATRFFPAINGQPSPYFYDIDSQDLLRIVLEIEDADEDIVCIYHSHVESPAFPSRTDVELAAWPDAAYLIVSLGSEPPEVKAFTIRDGTISRREITLTD